MLINSYCKSSEHRYADEQHWGAPVMKSLFMMEDLKKFQMLICKNVIHTGYVILPAFRGLIHFKITPSMFIQQYFLFCETSGDTLLRIESSKNLLK